MNQMRAGFGAGVVGQGACTPKKEQQRQKLGARAASKAAAAGGVRAGQGDEWHRQV